MSFTRNDYDLVNEDEETNKEDDNPVHSEPDADETSTLIKKTTKAIYNSYSNDNSNPGFNRKHNHHQQQQNYLNQLLLTAMNDRRSKFQQQASYLIILVVYTLERFAFYGLICNYVLYLNKQPLYWESFNASFLLFIFLGILNITSVLGGWIADSLIGKYLTICLSFFVYIIGYAAFPFLSYSRSTIPNYCNSNSSRLDWSNITLGSDGFLATRKPDRSIFEETCSWVIILNAVLIGIGSGFIRANLGPFGADQVR